MLNKFSLLFLILFSFSILGNEIDQYLIEHQINHFTSQTNQSISKEKNRYFAAQVFKKYIENNQENLNLKNDILNQMNHNVAALDLANTLLVVNMGLGWDYENLSEQPYYVQNFVKEIQQTGLPVYFIKKYPYAPLEQNIESIKPQLDVLMKQSNQKIILFTLCKGSPEMVVALNEYLKENPDFKTRFKAHINLSGMMGGTFFANNRPDLKILREIELMIGSNHDPDFDFKKYDQRQTLWSLPYMNDKIIKTLLNPNQLEAIESIKAVNISGIITKKENEKRPSPLKMFFTYNHLTNLYPYANEGFLDIADTRLPEKMYPYQRTILIEGSHLLADGNFENFDLTQSSNRLKLYRLLIKSIN